MASFSASDTFVTTFFDQHNDQDRVQERKIKKDGSLALNIKTHCFQIKMKIEVPRLIYCQSLQ